MVALSYGMNSEKFKSKDHVADTEDKTQNDTVHICAHVKTFCLCLFMVVITFSLGLAVVTLSPKLQATKENGHRAQAADPESVLLNMSGSVPLKFDYLNRMKQSKKHVLPGGVIQWARYLANPADYDTKEERAFGTNIHKNGARMTAATLEIKVNGLRVPHWHFNANEHGYLVKGKVWVGILDTAPFSVTSFNMTVGQTFFLPRGTMHWVKCVGRVTCLLILFFTTSDELITRDLDDVFYATPQDIAARSLKPKGGIKFIKSFKKPKENQAINLPPNLNELVQKASYTTSWMDHVAKYFLNLRGSWKYKYPGGTMQWARYTKQQSGLPWLERIFAKSLHEHEDSLTMALMRIYRGGMRQPHYHFDAHTMGYVVKGWGRVGVDHNSTEFSIRGGDVVFFPGGMQHYIKNVGKRHLLIVFVYSTHNELHTLGMDVYFQHTPDFILAQNLLKKQREFHKIPKFKRDQDINLP